MKTKNRPIPIWYLDEKIGHLNSQYQRLVLQGEHGVDQLDTLREIEDYARVIRLEAQKWIGDRQQPTRDDVVIADMDREYHHDG